MRKLDTNIAIRERNILDSTSLIRSQLLNTGLLIGAILGVVTMASTLSVSSEYHKTIAFYSDIVCIVILYTTYFLRNRINPRLKIIIALAVIFIFFGSNLLVYGAIATQSTLIALIPFLSILIYSFRTTLIIFGSVLLFYSVAAYLFITETFIYTYGENYNAWPSVWVTSGFIMLIVGLIIALLLNNYNQSINTILSELQEKTKKIELRDLELLELLNAKDIMIQEIHHRVKNNLAVVSGLLELQMKAINDETLTHVMQKSSNRILSIAKVHQMLYQAEDFDKVPFNEYIDDLAKVIFDTMNSEDKAIEFNSHIQIPHLSINHSVPLGIIFNELITNSIKYGFEESESNKICVSIQQEQDKIQVSYSDNGVGIQNFEEALSHSLGFSLITSLLAQIDAIYHFDTTNQFKLDFSFPINS